MQITKNLKIILPRIILLLVVGISFFMLSATPELPKENEDTTFKTCAQNYPAKGKWGAAFFDLIDGGTCCSCPKGYKRPATVYPASSNKACVAYRKATKVGRYGCKNKYGGSAFFDATQGGTCWTCPSGYKRTAEPVTHAKACAKDFIFGPWSRATKKGSSKCDKGIADPIEGGTCWQCPRGGKRTVYAVNSSQACELNSKAMKRGPDTQLMDLSSAAKAKVKKVTQDLSNKTKDIMKQVKAIHEKVNGPLKQVFKSSSFANNIKNGNYGAVWNQVKGELQPLVNKISILGNQQLANLKKFKALSISVSGSASAGIGMGTEQGLLIDFTNGIKLKGFYNYSLTGKASVGIGNAVTVGLWKNTIDCGTGFGISVGFSVPTPAGVSVGVTGSIAIDVNRACRKEWVSYLNLDAIEGISISGTVGVGVGADIGVGFVAQMLYEVSGGRLRKACRTSCGARGQRPCSVVERFPSCNVGLIEKCGKCQ